MRQFAPHFSVPACSSLWRVLALRCYLKLVRTTIDLPDSLFRRTTRLAAMRRVSMKELIVQALEREINAQAVSDGKVTARALQFPLIRLRSGRKLDLSKFGSDEF